MSFDLLLCTRCLGPEKLVLGKINLFWATKKTCFGPRKKLVLGHKKTCFGPEKTCFGPEKTCFWARKTCFLAVVGRLQL